MLYLVLVIFLKSFNRRWENYDSYFYLLYYIIFFCIFFLFIEGGVLLFGIGVIFGVINK